MPSRAETGASGAKWRLRAVPSRALATAEPNEHAAQLSRELRRALVERLAGLSSQERFGGKDVDQAQGRDDQPASAGGAVRSSWPTRCPGMRRRTGIRTH